MNAQANSATKPHFLKFVDHGASPDEILQNFLMAIDRLGITPYPAQEEALLELMANKNLILGTPTGSGKTLVATALHFRGLSEGKRSFYTCPIKALVSEKFFALCDQFGAENVGMLTGDATINRDAPIICCTAEVLANYALSSQASQIPYVIMDEFHYYSDPERGVAWQLPLLCMSDTQFLLMSATIGDCQTIKDSLKAVTKKEVAEVSSMQRPVPLDYSYRETPLHETLADMLGARKYPIYVVNFTQSSCALEAQNAMSVDIATKEEKKAIDAALEGFRFDTPFGKDIKRFIRHGVGIHHAGLLPKYRLLTEKLAQGGLLKIIMGTDTLGVGVNVPIRTVVFTKLCKFDGEKTRILSKRDFKQIAGRAGRKGFDTEGSVIAQAPEHVIENKRAENRYAEADKHKKRKVVKKPAPTKNYVHFDEETFRRLIEEPPETLVSQFRVTHAMILNALADYEGNGNPGYRNLIAVIGRCHDSPKNRSKHRKRAAQLFKSLLQANIFSIVKNIKTGARVVANESLQQDFSLHHALSLYLIEALSVMERNQENYALDVLSLVEAIEENPRPILLSQVDKKKSQALAEMKQEGVEFDARIEALEKIEYDKPCADFIYESFNMFRHKHPWVESENIHPKSITRAMFETGATFNEYVSELNLARAEGLLLRYVSQTYKGVMQSVPDQFKNDDLLDVIAYLRTMLNRVDTSLIDEWESLFEDGAKTSLVPDAKVELPPFDPRVNHKAFLAKVRAELFHVVRLLSQKNYQEAISSLNKSSTFDAAGLERALEPFFEEYGELIADPRARSPQLTRLKKLSDTHYEVEHMLLDPRGDNMWYLKGRIDLDSTGDLSEPIIQISEVSS